MGRRADRALAKVDAALANTEGVVVLVAHGHFLRVLTARWLGLPPSKGALFQLATGTLCRLGTEHGRPVIAAWNVRPRRSLRMGAPTTSQWAERREGARRDTTADRRAAACVIDAADPVTGRLRGTETQLAALVKRGLAFRHPRPPHDHFLTPAGHRIRESPPDVVEPAPAVAPATTTSASGVFAARIGGEDASDTAPAARTREVHSAWQGLLELRRMTNPDGSVERPCGWERTHLVQAAALALEAAGHRPAVRDATGQESAGYKVRVTPQPEAVAVRDPDGEALRACAGTLERAGWQVSEHKEPRTGASYLLASPRRT